MNTNPGGLCKTTARTRQGLLFETGTPVTFRYMRRDEPAPYLGSRFGQDIEPAGTYMVLDEYDLWREDPALSPGWSFGEHTFHSPLVLELVVDDGGHGGKYGALTYGPTGWKQRLSEAYGGRRGAALSRAILKSGYDGIVTVGTAPNDVREIVDLTRMPRSAAMRAKKNPFYLYYSEDGAPEEELGPMSSITMKFEDIQVEGAADFIVDVSDYTWKQVGELLQEVRGSQGMTQAEVARRAGISTRHYRNMERGYEATKEHTLKAVSNALGFRIDGRPKDIPPATKRHRERYEAKKAAHDVLIDALGISTLPKKKNPVVPEIRSQIHPSWVRRLEQMEFEAVFYSDMADLLYSEGLEEKAEEYDVAAAEAMERLENVSAEILESGEPLTGGSAWQEGFTFDAQRFLITAWAMHLFYQRTGTFCAGGAQVATRSQLAEYIRMVLTSQFQDFRPTTTDQQLVEAAEDAYEDHIEYRLKQLTGLRGAAAPLYLPGQRP